MSDGGTSPVPNNNSIIPSVWPSVRLGASWSAAKHCRTSVAINLDRPPTLPPPPAWTSVSLRTLFSPRHPLLFWSPMLRPILISPSFVFQRLRNLLSTLRHSRSLSSPPLMSSAFFALPAHDFPRQSLVAHWLVRSGGTEFTELYCAATSGPRCLVCFYSPAG